MRHVVTEVAQQAEPGQSGFGNLPTAAQQFSALDVFHPGAIGRAQIADNVDLFSMVSALTVDRRPAGHLLGRKNPRDARHWQGAEALRQEL